MSMWESQKTENLAMISRLKSSSSNDSLKRIQKVRMTVGFLSNHS